LALTKFTLNIEVKEMKKVRLKHQKPMMEEDDKKWIPMNESCLKDWIESGINEGLDARNIQDAIGEMFDTDKIKQILLNSLMPEILEAVSPYYREEFYSSLNGGKIVISPWWDDFWQEVKLTDLIENSIDGIDHERLTRTRDALIKSLAIVNREIKSLMEVSNDS